MQFAGAYDSFEEAIYTSAQAVIRGIPAMDVKSGELYSINDRFIDPITEVVISVMRELSMNPGEPSPAPAPVMITERARVYREYEGIWYPEPLEQAGDYVSAGSALAYTTDYYGNRLADMTAPDSGILLILFGTPPVTIGDNVAVIGRIPK